MKTRSMIARMPPKAQFKQRYKKAKELAKKMASKAARKVARKANSEKKNTIFYKS